MRVRVCVCASAGVRVRVCVCASAGACGLQRTGMFRSLLLQSSGAGCGSCGCTVLEPTEVELKWSSSSFAV